MTYPDDNTADDIVKSRFIKIPLTQIPKDSESSSKNSDIQKWRNPGEELECSVQKANSSLAEIIRNRANDTLRTNETTRSLVNKRMLREFTGFHGELTKYWDEIVADTAQRTMQNIAEDNLKNKRRTLASRMKSDWENLRREKASKQRAIEMSDDPSSLNHHTKLQIEKGNEEIGGRVGSNMSRRFQQEAERSSNTKPEMSQPEPSIITSFNQELAATIESLSERLYQAANQASDLSSALRPATLDTSVEEMKTAPPVVNDAPAGVEKFEDPTVVGEGVSVEGISSRLDEPTKELEDIRSELTTDTMAVGINDSHSTSPTIPIPLEIVLGKEDSVAAVEDRVNLDDVSDRLDQASKGPLDLRSVLVPEVDEFPASGVEDGPTVISETTETLSNISLGDERPENVVSETVFGKEDLVATEGKHVDMGSITDRLDQAAKELSDFRSSLATEVDEVSSTSEAEERPAMISEITQPRSDVSVEDGRLESVSDQLDHVSKTLSDVHAELTPLVSNSKDPHTTPNPLETSAETASAPSSDKIVD